MGVVTDPRLLLGVACWHSWDDSGQMQGTRIRKQNRCVCPGWSTVFQTLRVTSRSHWARMAKTEGLLFRQVVCRHILMACSCLFTTIRGNEEARVLVVFLYHRLWEVSSVALAVSILFSVYEVPFCISSFKVQVGFCAQLSIQTNFGFSDSCVVSCILIKVVLQGNDGWAKVPKVLKFLFHNC